jgi:hypothetical protein
MSSIRLSLSIALLTATVAAAADKNAATFTDPEKAGIDYELQGEYAATVKTDEGEEKVGVQVIALGEGKFRAVGFIGGLPGDGWSRSDKQHSSEGQLEDGVVSFKHDDPDSNIRGELKDGKLTVYAGDIKIADIPKVKRKSPTLGKKPPEGAVVLFDGSSTDAWENPKLVDGKLLGATNVSTKRKFGDHKLHIEFRTPFMPTARGQSRGNSGVYLQRRYEVQVLDSFGLEGKDNECGGIYSISEPAVNMCLPPLVWQTYDIEFSAARYDDNGKKVKNARITVKHNGFVIHDDVELPQETAGQNKEGPEQGSLFMQDHSNPVVFRNIWIVEK